MRLFLKTFFLIGFCFLTGHCALAASASSGKWEQLLAAAKKEGEVVMIGPTIPDLRQVYTEEFPKDTGIRLLYEGLGPALVFAAHRARGCGGEDFRRRHFGRVRRIEDPLSKRPASAAEAYSRCARGHRCFEVDGRKTRLYGP
jgi:hypothetical protein